MPIARFANLRDIDDVATAVGVPAASIASYADATLQALAYVKLKIPKLGRRRAGQFRVVHKARHDWLSGLHRSVAIMVTKSTAFAEHVQGFVQHRSILTNAQRHLGARLVLHADIQGFFDAITVAQVKRGFISLGANEEVAHLLARVCTIDGNLRQGTRCSPVLANLVCMELDVALLALATSHGSTYTRYADDLTFSGDSVPSSDAVKAVLKQHGFELRDGRCYVQRRGHGQFVTGLHVGDSLRPRLPRRLKRRLRLVLHCIDKFGTDAHFAHAARRPVVKDHLGLEGMLRYVQSIERALALKLRAKFRAGSKKSFDLRKTQGG